MPGPIDRLRQLVPAKLDELTLVEPMQQPVATESRRIGGTTAWKVDSAKSRS